MLEHTSMPAFHPKEVEKVNNTSQQNICLKKCHTLCWWKTLPCATLVFPVLGLTEWGKLLCSNSSLALGPYTSSLSYIDMLGLPFYNSYWMLPVHGREIMNYQLNHGRFTDDWSNCVVRTSTKEGKTSDTSVLHGISAELEVCRQIRQWLIIWIE